MQGGVMDTTDKSNHAMTALHDFATLEQQ